MRPVPPLLSFRMQRASAQLPQCQAVAFNSQLGRQLRCPNHHPYTNSTPGQPTCCMALPSSSSSRPSGTSKDMLGSPRGPATRFNRGRAALQQQHPHRPQGATGAESADPVTQCNTTLPDNKSWLCRLNRSCDQPQQNPAVLLRYTSVLAAAPGSGTGPRRPVAAMTLIPARGAPGAC